MDFSELNLPVPENIHKKTFEIQKNVFNYLSNMNQSEKKAYLIAYEHLGSSFNILKSNGYIEWSQNKK